MMNSENIQVSGVAETMLQTMYARAAYSQKPGHKFYDGKAIEIAKAMNYDFSKADKDALMSNGAPPLLAGRGTGVHDSPLRYGTRLDGSNFPGRGEGSGGD